MKIWLVVVSGLLFAWLGKETEKKKDNGVLASTQVEVSTVIKDLDQPWEISWGPDNHIWFTEHAGSISRMDPVTGKRVVLITIPDVVRLTTPGLMGLAFHPDFKKNHYLYTNYTFRNTDSVIWTRLVRYTYTGGKLLAPKVLLEIPANRGHTGSRLTISPDRKLMYATGDAAVFTNAQSLTSLNGKVLRLNLDGSVPEDNPIKGSYIWTWGHRNIQGLTYGKNGLLYSSEHGDAVEDELNIIEPMQNYGWPRVEGYCDQPKEKLFCDSVKVTPPLRAWTPVIAPAGLDYYGSTKIPEWTNSLLQVTLKDSDLRVLKLDPTGRKVLEETIYFDKKYGRIRDVCVSPEGDVYLSTSNRDWNPGVGFPVEGDDRIIRIRKKKGGADLISLSGPAKETTVANEPAGKKLYTQYCSSCHKEDGKGVAGVFPALAGSPVVNGAKPVLIRVLLEGISEENQPVKKSFDQSMPSFQFLKDHDIAYLANYIRTQFGNNQDRILPQHVTAAREKSAK